MDNHAMQVIQAAQRQQMTQTLQQCNGMTQRYGLTLTLPQMFALMAERQNALVESGRMELGEGILPTLIYAFCDSPYLIKEEYAQQLMTLQNLFYLFKNDTDGILADDELLLAMKRLFNDKGHGSLEYLENATVSDIVRAALGREESEDGDDDAWDD